jgi:hypothetical protein
VTNLRSICSPTGNGSSSPCAAAAGSASRFDVPLFGEHDDQAVLVDRPVQVLPPAGDLDGHCCNGRHPAILTARSPASWRPRPSQGHPVPDPPSAARRKELGDADHGRTSRQDHKAAAQCNSPGSMPPHRFHQRDRRARAPSTQPRPAKTSTATHRGRTSGRMRGVDGRGGYLARAVTDLALARLRRAGLAEGSGVPVAARRALTSLAS